MEQKVLVGKSLSRAFRDDPFYQAITVDFTDEEERAAILARYFELAIDEAVRIGEVVCAGMDGAAIWVTNEADQVVASASSRTRSRAVERLLGTSGFGNYVRISASMADNMPARLHDAWYLSILGVHPGAQGKGIASELLRSTLSRADDLGVSCFLETYNPSSLAFYERADFARRLPASRK